MRLIIAFGVWLLGTAGSAVTSIGGSTHNSALSFIGGALVGIVSMVAAGLVYDALSENSRVR